MELHGLKVPLAASAEQLDGVDALFVEDYELVSQGVFEARRRDQVDRTVRVTPHGNR